MGDQATHRGVFGETTGLAPGYKGSLSWRMIEGYSEGEYVFTGEAADSFFYNWSELTLAPVEWFRGGIVTQRTRAYKTDREIQRGLLVGATYQKLDVTAYVFNPDDSKPTVVLAVGLSWRAWRGITPEGKQLAVSRGRHDLGRLSER